MNKKYTGFKTFSEMMDFRIELRKEKEFRCLGDGWNEKDKHFFEVEE